MSPQDIVLSEEEQIALSRRIRSATISQRDGRRTRVILLAARGCSRNEIAQLTGLSVVSVTRCLVDLHGRGRKPFLPAEALKRALERTQPGLPLGIGHIRTQSHDYVLHGTVTLFTALDYLQGRLISSIERQYRHLQWLEFLKKINRETPKHLQLHLIVDNDATHKHPKVQVWLNKRIRPAKSSTRPLKAKTWCALKFKWAPVLAF